MSSQSWKSSVLSRWIGSADRGLVIATKAFCSRAALQLTTLFGAGDGPCWRPSRSLVAWLPLPPAISAPYQCQGALRT